MVNIDISDDSLFGNLMAQHEDAEIFKSYVYERNDFKSFWDNKQKIQIISAIKGSGKSALCRLAKYKITKNFPDEICLLKYDSDISPDIDSLDTSTWIKEWKKNFLHIIACELGKKIGIAWQDDTMTLVEEARKGGFRQQSLLNAIFNRIKSKHIPVSTTAPKKNITDEFVSRVTSSENNIWLIVDEVDQHFDNSDRQMVKLTSFFLACSELSIKIPQIKFRLTVRPNIWTILKTNNSSLAGINQYIFNLEWSNDQIRTLLARRVSAYLDRNLQTGFIPKISNNIEKEEWLISQVFTGRFDLGSGSRPPHMALSTLAAKRPRWIMELCKSAAANACGSGDKTIKYKNIEGSLEYFGYSRMQDLAAEYKEKCKQLLEIMKSFTGSKYFFEKTHNYLHYISENIVDVIDVNIAGNTTETKSIDIANLLYCIDFVHARMQEIPGEYKHVYFSDRPDLLIHEKQANRDTVFSWEIHPMFRYSLYLRKEDKIGSLPTKRIGKCTRKGKNRTNASTRRRKAQRR